MNHHRHLTTRRETIRSLAALAAGVCLRPAAAFASPVNDRLRFVVIGDWGTGEKDQDAIARQMVAVHQRKPFDFILTVGDNIYPSGNGRDFLKKFERPFAALLRERINFYAALGNHDVVGGRQDQCQYPLFNMSGRCYYTLRRGDGLAEFFMLDSTDFDQAQTGWLEQTLRASTAKWKIAAFHHPLYSSGKRHGHDLKLRRTLEPLFQRYQVRTVFSGHDHIYERSKPQQGIHYFVTGAGGQIRRGGVNLKSPTREVSYDQDNHFMLVELDDRQLHFQAISESGPIVDAGTITPV